MFGQQKVALALILLGCCVTNSLQGGLINGSFESPAIPTTTTFQRFGGGTNLGGWTVLGTEVYTISNSYGELFHDIPQFNSQEGAQSLDLTGAFNSGLTNGVQQTVDTMVGGTYLLSFYVGRASHGPAYTHPTRLYSTPSIVDVSIDGGIRTPFTTTSETPGAIHWEQFSLSFTATSASTSIAFFNGTDLSTNNFVGLDNVQLQQITAVPEPSSLLLIGMGTVVFSLAVCRRKR